MCVAEVATIRQAQIEAERQAGIMRDAARKLADRLAEQTLHYEAKLAETGRRLQDAIRKKASPVRRAFTDDSITRMLNEQAEIREYVDGKAVPAAAEPDAADGSAAENRTGSASEQAVATWAAKMVEYAQTCRTRLHGLQAWAREVSQ